MHFIRHTSKLYKKKAVLNNVVITKLFRHSWSMKKRWMLIALC